MKGQQQGSSSFPPKETQKQSTPTENDDHDDNLKSIAVEMPTSELIIENIKSDRTSLKEDSNSHRVSSSASWSLDRIPSLPLPTGTTSAAAMTTSSSYVSPVSSTSSTPSSPFTRMFSETDIPLAQFDESLGASKAMTAAGAGAARRPSSSASLSSSPQVQTQPQLSSSFTASLSGGSEGNGRSRSMSNSSSQNYYQNQQFLAMTTIENSSPRSKKNTNDNSISMMVQPPRKDSDDVPLHIPPVHQFFSHPPQYDSDGSDGSFVPRSRHGSFDSAGSSGGGSIKYVSSTGTAQRSPRQLDKPRILPYHERQKILKARQQHQKQGSHQQTLSNQQQHQRVNPLHGASVTPGDPRSIPMYPHNYHGSLPQQLQQQSALPQNFNGQFPPPPPPPMDPAQVAAYMNMYGMPPPPYPPMGYYGYPPPIPGYAASLQEGTSATRKGSGLKDRTQPQAHPHMPHSPNPYGYPMPPQQYPTFHQQQPFAFPSPYGNTQIPLHEQHQPPTPYLRQQQEQQQQYFAHNDKNSARGASISRSQAASARQSQNTRIRVPYMPSSSAEDSIMSPPPPPPPLAMPPTNHIRADSFGSLSSLEGVDSHMPVTKSRTSGNTDGRPKKNDSFLDLLRQQWAPRDNVALAATMKSPSGGGPTHRRQQSSQDSRPPASRGNHKRLPSISNDNWEDDNGPSINSVRDGGFDSDDPYDQQRRMQELYYGHDSGEASELPTDEQTNLLPPSGISSDELDGSKRRPMGRRGSGHRRNPSSGGFIPQVSLDATMEPSGDVSGSDRKDDFLRRTECIDNRGQHKKKTKKKKRHDIKNRGIQLHSQNTAEEHSYQKWTRKSAKMLEAERAKLIMQWKQEAEEEAEWIHQEREAQAAARNGRLLWERFSKRINRFIIGVEAFIANMPLTIGAVAMAVVTLGVVWFKFAEENIDSCEPVHFHSSQCTFPEFPGCFYCNTNDPLYKAALTFHFACKIFAGFLAMLFVLKVLIATRVVLDELSSPTTASPAGLLCMTTVCVFAGRGDIGKFMVTTAASIHIALVFWFVYMALAYRSMPDPSWFPNTVGVGMSAVKIWLYYPTTGHLLMAVSLASNFFFFPVSLIRVAINKKISATVGWMQMSAPAISLYALTIMAQPSFAEEHPDVTHFQRVHRMVYLPCMHAMAALSILGFLASCHSLWTRWDDFKKKDFSPAHAAFCFPVLSHANALQAYRGAIISFSPSRPDVWMSLLNGYWFTILICGTVATLWITARFIYCLPKWTNLDLQDEEEPPAPNQTIIAMRDIVTAGETMRQPFVSPAVLQANETGALVWARSGPNGDLRYVRTRRLTALGFEPIMNWSEMQTEREVLLDFVAKHPPRRRHRTLSVPGVDFQYGNNFGTDNAGIYGTMSWSGTGSRHRAGPELRNAY